MKLALQESRMESLNLNNLSQEMVALIESTDFAKLIKKSEN
jgi:hypothetical protein